MLTKGLETSGKHGLITPVIAHHCMQSKLGRQDVCLVSPEYRPLVTTSFNIITVSGRQH